MKPLPRGPLNKLLTLHIADCKLTRENIMKTLGERIRELREQHDFSVRELAKKLKVSAAFFPTSNSGAAIHRKMSWRDLQPSWKQHLKTSRNMMPVPQFRSYDASPQTTRPWDLL